jgi:hypothetical protein
LNYGRFGDYSNGLDVKLSEWLALILGGSGALGWLVNILRPLFRRGLDKAAETKTSVEASILLVNELQEELKEARDLLRKERSETLQAAAIANRATAALARATNRMNRIVELIHDPYITIDQLRLRVPAQSTSNGTEES